MKANDFKNKAFEDMLKYAAREANREMIDGQSAVEEVEFSKEHEEKMKKLFKQYRKSVKARKSKCLKRTILIAAVIMGISIMTMTISALRVRFLNFMINIKDTHTEISYVPENEDKNTYSAEDVDFGYFPEGFELAESRNSGKRKFLKFNNNELNFELNIRDLDTTFDVDTEKGNANLIKLNNLEAFIAEKDGVVSINWNNKVKAFRLSGNVGRDELIKIAENLIIK